MLFRSIHTRRCASISYAGPAIDARAPPRVNIDVIRSVYDKVKLIDNDSMIVPC